MKKPTFDTIIKSECTSFYLIYIFLVDFFCINQWITGVKIKQMSDKL